MDEKGFFYAGSTRFKQQGNCFLVGGGVQIHGNGVIQRWNQTEHNAYHTLEFVFGQCGDDRECAERGGVATTLGAGTTSIGANAKGVTASTTMTVQ